MMTIKSWAMLSAGMAVAMTQTAVAEQNYKNSVGLGVAKSSGVYLDYDNDATAVPIISYQRGNFYIKGTEIGYKIWDNGTTLAVIGNFNLYEFDSDESDQLRQLDDRDGSFEGGARLTLGDLNLVVVTDLSDEHDGQRLDLNYGFPFNGRNKSWNVIPAVGVEWQSDDYTDHYYGVSAAESARTGGMIATYEADSAVNPYLKVDGHYRLSNRWNLVGSAKYVSLDDEISDSTMVEDDSFGVIMVGFSYRF
ncbi:MAG: MipA/OmpV family protein [Porticoccus sp.]